MEPPNAGGAPQAPEPIDRLRRALRQEPVGPSLVVANRYEILKELGAGAMGLVFSALDRQLKRPVALKILKDEIGAYPSSRQRFLREAQTAAGLAHPNVVTVHDAGESDGRLFLVMELVEGMPLGDLMVRRGRPMRELVALLEKVARGVAAAHARGVVHRDLKPGNILVTAAGEPKVADFGLARLTTSETSLTRTGAAVGTPLYMAPEQIEGASQQITPRTDVYALGVILYEMLTGRPPHAGESASELFTRILRDDPRPPRQINPAIPWEIEAVCLKALEKLPPRRYASAADFADDLRRFLAGEPVRARRTTRWNRALRLMRRNKPLAALAAALVIAVAGGTLALALQLARMGEHQRRHEWIQRLSTHWVAVTERKAELRQLRAPAEQARRNLRTAVDEIDAHIRIRPDEPHGYYVRARGRLYLGDLAGARSDLELVGRRWPDFRPGWSLLGVLEMEDYQRVAYGTEEFNPHASDRKEQLRAFLDRCAAAFAKGWTAGQEREESARWGLPWTREDQIIERVARAIRLVKEKDDRSGARRLLEEGVREFQAEEYARTLGLLTHAPAERRAWLDQAVKWAPGFAEALVDRSSTRSSENEFAGMIDDCTRALEVRPDFAAAYVNRSFARSRLKDFAGSAEDAGKALELGADPAIASSNRAFARLRLSDYEGAVADCDRALEVRPGWKRPLLTRAQARQQLGDWPRAGADFDAILLSDPDHVAALSGRGFVRRSQGDLEGAMKDCNRAIELDPAFSEAWLHRGTVHVSLQEYEAAAADFTHAIGLQADFWKAHFNRAVARTRMGDHDGALEDYDRTLTLNPRLAGGWNNRGNLKFQLGDVEGALADLDQAVTLQDSADHRTGRAVILEKLGLDERAEADYAEALKKAPPAWPKRAAVEQRLADVRKRLGKP